KFLIEGSELIEKELENIERQNLRKQLIHKDMHPENILYNVKTGEYKLIDTSELDYELLPREITNSLSHFLFEELDIKNSAVGTIFDSYQRNYPLNKDEINSIPIFWIDRLLGIYVYFSFLLINGTLNENEFCEQTKYIDKHFKFFIKGYSNLKSYFEKKHNLITGHQTHAKTHHI
ncbi:MAG: hypothetical protein KAS62_02585, partial [Candidatus Delongbacteria bacterium]|nr:hypothetical protein [Candidatus Delongbacteria bacterium]